MTTRKLTRRRLLQGASIALGMVVAGCAQQPPSPVSQPTSAPVATEAPPTVVPPTEAKPVSLSLWGWWDTRMNIYAEAAKAYAADQPNVQIAVETVPGGELNQKVYAALAAGTGPTMLKMGTNFFKLREEGHLIELPEEIFPSDWLKQTYPDVDWSIYGRYVFTTGAMPVLMIYNKKMFADAGLDPEVPPATWADLLAFARKLTQKDDSGAISVCGYVPAMDDYPGVELTYQTGGNIIQIQDGKQVSGWTTDAVRQVYQLLSDMAFKDMVWDSSFPGDTEAVGTGKAAITIDESWIIGEFKNTYADVYGDLGYALPATPSGKADPYYGYKRYVLDVAVMKGRADEYLPAFQFIEYMQKQRPDVIMRLCEISTLIPNRPDLTSDPKVLESPVNKVGIEALPKEYDVVMQPDELWQIVADLVNRIAVQQVPLEEALALADAEWQQVLDDGLAKYMR